MSVRLLLSLTLLFSLTFSTLGTAADTTPKRELNAAETEHALQLLAEELTKNLDAIHTWQGTCLFQNQVRLTDPRITKDSKWQTTEGQYTFWLDRLVPHDVDVLAGADPELLVHVARLLLHALLEGHRPLLRFHVGLHDLLELVQELRVELVLDIVVCEEVLGWWSRFSLFLLPPLLQELLLVHR